MCGDCGERSYRSAPLAPCFRNDFSLVSCRRNSRLGPRVSVSLCRGSVRGS